MFKRLSLEPNTETIVWARVPNYITLGLQGVCSKSKFSCGKGLLVAKSVVTVPYNRKVPVKLLNLTSENVVIPKGRTIAEFSVLNNEYECASFSDTIPEVQHVDVSETIDSPHSKFTCSKPDYSKREILREHLDNLLKQGIIAPVSETEDLLITSPIVLVTKRSKNSAKPCAQDFRFCCDFRFLNSQTREFKYAIPNLQELTESFSEVIPNFISSIDLSSGFFQMGLSNDSSQYTAFNTCFGTYKFSRLPMGLKTAPNTFQMLMDKVLHGLKFKSCLCYLDDVLIFSDTFEKHLSDLKEVFQRFRAAGLKLGPKKCSFAASSCVFLGHLISKDGIRPPPDRVKAISDYPRPKNIKELRRLLGLFNWFRKFIPNYSALVFPLTRLLKKRADIHMAE
ncbi:unnamed protein product [Mytilus edulis]|uniref:Reverse transcriptase domain-containing protein n=1 Tax=Mytilus edulis TaxID=6550 RepID=A0A8S3UI58_MYTED|nr:unnamed protein product [Mytilus edulis]